MSTSVDDAAISWAIRIDAENMDGAQKRALDDWLAQDRRHRGALFRAQAGLALLDTMAEETEPLPSVATRWSRRRFVVPAGLAACMATVLAFSWPMSGQQYRTDVGEIRRISLSDGSVAMVNSGSELEVHYEDTVRQLRLDEGEAWFNVAKNRQRPFLVEAGGVHVRATGTAFSVRLRDRAVEVVVTEGTVLVWREGQQKDAVTVSAGNTTTVPTLSGTSRPQTVAIGDRDPLAWRQGGLALNETTVFEAVAEFNRYNLVPIEVVNPRIGKQLMTGYFQIDRPKEFSQAVADVTGATLSNTTSKYVIE